MSTVDPLREALEHAREALHRACLVIGSTDGFRGDFDGINEALAAAPVEVEYEYRAMWDDEQQFPERRLLGQAAYDLGMLRRRYSLPDYGHVERRTPAVTVEPGLWEPVTDA